MICFINLFLFAEDPSDDYYYAEEYGEEYDYGDDYYYNSRPDNGQ